MQGGGGGGGGGCGVKLGGVKVRDPVVRRVDSFI